MPATIEFDHLFVCSAVNAPKADQLSSAGFSEGQSNSHPGQGTSCRRFFFHNAYLEFLWVHNQAEACSELVNRTRLWERWRFQQTGYCPFGIGLRSSPPNTTPAKLPLKTWSYSPPYLPPTTGIAVAESDHRPTEPFVFLLPAGARPDEYKAGYAQPLEHACGVKEITGVCITLVGEPISEALRAIERLGVVSLNWGQEYLAEVSFDGQQNGGVLDCRPGVPLVLRW